MNNFVKIDLPNWWYLIPNFNLHDKSNYVLYIYIFFNCFKSYENLY